MNVVQPAYPSPLSWRGLCDLFVRPTRFFTGADLGRGWAWIVAAWLVGTAFAIDRVDKNLMSAELGVSRPESEPFTSALASSWVVYWPTVVVMGAVAAAIVWMVGGWWYNVRLRWSGATLFDPRDGRLVYIFAGLVYAAPAILYSVIATGVFPNYLAAWESEEYWSLSLLIFPFWATVVSYKGVRARFQPRTTPARIWFLVLPMALYAVGFGAIALLRKDANGELDKLALLRSSNPADAARGLERYVESKPRDDLAWTILGHTYIDLDEHDKAAASYERALELNPKRVEAITAMGVLRSGERRYDEALAFYDRALTIDPNYAQAYSSIAVIALNRGDDVKALNYTRKAFALDSTDAVIAANLALAYHYNDMRPMRDHMTKVAQRLGYRNIDRLRRFYTGELTVRDP